VTPASPRQLLRRWLERTPTGRALVAWRTRGQAEALLAARGLRDTAMRLDASLASQVRRGPFAAMQYPRRRGDIVHAAKLLGAYERELHDALERLIARTPRLIVNIGSGDGFYVVGLARRVPAARVLAVDPDPIAQRACRQTAQLNHVADRVAHRVLLDAPALQRELAQATVHAGVPNAVRALCVVDCEGFEDSLLDPVAAPALRQADLLIETHDFARPGVTARLSERFAASHHIERIEIAARTVADYPELSDLPVATAQGLLDEFRHVPQSWLVCLARA
jgi:Ribosomal protein L11 methyltransferase (PrmA)